MSSNNESDGGEQALVAMGSMRLLVTGGSGFIGTNLVESFYKEVGALINLDKQEPLDRKHRRLWEQCDLLDAASLTQQVQQFSPTHVIHLAARADSDGRKLEEYSANTEGTSNLLKSLSDLASLQRLVLTSTQFVHKPGHLPESDEDFEPHTAYGESKIANERELRLLNPRFAWTIIRPTNIWGPWHPRYPREFWKVLRDGLYVHPGGKPVIRSYGYVRNIVWQIEQMLRAPREQVDRRVFYVGDEPINLHDWVDGFSRAIRGRPVRVVPRSVLWGLALGGEALKRLCLPAPIHLSRFRSMTEDYPTPMGPTLQTFGKPPYTLAEGIDQTVTWLREVGFFGGK